MKFSPDTATFRSNPYPHYDPLRQTTPLFYDEQWQAWFCLRYEDCHYLLRTHQDVPLLPPDDPLNQWLHHWVLMENPPTHTRMRELTHRAFFAQITNSLPQQIEQFAHDLLHALPRQRPFDFIADFAHPLAVKTMSYLVKLPQPEIANLSNLGHDIRLVLDLPPNSTLAHNALTSSEQLGQYAQKLIENYQPNQPPHFIGLIKESLKHDAHLTTAELYGVCIGLLINELVTIQDFASFMSGGLVALLHHPNQINLLQTKPSLIKSAIREFLRYETPVQATERIAGREFQLQGQTIPAGAHIYLLLGAANRDSERFEHPHEFNIARYPNPHLAFGGGIRACFGATLMYLMGEVTLQTLVPYLPQLTLATDTFEYADSFMFRCLQKLPLVFR